jgi:hypothetical protein
MAGIINTKLKGQLTEMKERDFILESVNASISGSMSELSDVDEDMIMDADSVPKKALKKVEDKIDQLIEDEDFDDELDMADDDAFFDDIDDEDFDDEDLDDIDDEDLE